jgi:polyhydroxyalkanoate synthesis regulator phasin
MVERPQAADSKASDESAVTPPPAPKRPPGHRSSDVRDTVAEMAARAQEISQEAGSKVAQAMKDVINAAAGLAGFAVESARDLVQYMVRRGQMTQEEADKLLREAEEAYSSRKPPVTAEERPAAPSEARKPTATKAAATKKPPAAKTARTSSASSASKGKTASSSSRAKAAAKQAATKSAATKKKR